jgi:hypothetical protein
VTTKMRNVRSYLKELEKTEGERTEQVKEGLEMYIDLWKKAIERGVIVETDEVDSALAKIEKAGGLYKAAGD